MNASVDAVAINGGGATALAQKAPQGMGTDAGATDIATQVERPMAIVHPLVAGDPAGPHIGNQPIGGPMVPVAVSGGAHDGDLATPGPGANVMSGGGRCRESGKAENGKDKTRTGGKG